MGRVVQEVVKVYRHAHKVGARSQKVHHAEIDEDLACLCAQVRYQRVGDDDEQSAEHREEAGCHDEPTHARTDRVGDTVHTVHLLRMGEVDQGRPGEEVEGEVGHGHWGEGPGGRGEGEEPSIHFSTNIPTRASQRVSTALRKQARLLHDTVY